MKGFRSILYFNILNKLTFLSSKLKKRMAERNTDALIKIMEKNDIKILTHPGDKVDVNIVRLAEACEKYGTALEINSSHRNMTVDQIKLIKDRKVKVSVGSDAHDPLKIGNFDKAISRIEVAGLPLESLINLLEK